MPKSRLGSSFGSSDSAISDLTAAMDTRQWLSVLAICTRAHTRSTAAISRVDRQQASVAATQTYHAGEPDVVVELLARLPRCIAARQPAAAIVSHAISECNQNEMDAT